MHASTALVIGNSDGIGLALTRLLLDRGYRVEGISRSPAPIRHDQLHQLTLDVTDPGYVDELDQLFERVQDIGYVVYCAGIGELLVPDALERDLRVFEVNLLGALRSAQVAVPAMLQSGRGRFIVLSSQADGIVSDEATSYCASKAALSSFFEGLALKLRHSPVRICNVRFGFVDTKMARAGIQPFRIPAERAAKRILGLIEGCCPRRVTYPRRMALVVAVVAFIQRWRVAFG